MLVDKETIQALLERFFDLYDLYDDIDLNPVLDKYISWEVMFNHELNYPEMFETLTQEDANKLLEDMNNYIHI